jgi:hypothetical protein
MWARRPREETTHLVAAVESKGSLRLEAFGLGITQIFDTKEFENKIL